MENIVPEAPTVVGDPQQQREESKTNMESTDGAIMEEKANTPTARLAPPTINTSKSKVVPLDEEPNSPLTPKTPKPKGILFSQRTSQTQHIFVTFSNFFLQLLVQSSKMYDRSLGFQKRQSTAGYTTSWKNPPVLGWPQRLRTS